MVKELKVVCFPINGDLVHEMSISDTLNIVKHIGGPSTCQSMSSRFSNFESVDLDPPKLTNYST